MYHVLQSDVSFSEILTAAILLQKLPKRFYEQTNYFIFDPDCFLTSYVERWEAASMLLGENQNNLDDIIMI